MQRSQTISSSYKHPRLRAKRSERHQPCFIQSVAKTAALAGVRIQRGSALVHLYFWHFQAILSRDGSYVALPHIERREIFVHHLCAFRASTHCPALRPSRSGADADSHAASLIRPSSNAVPCEYAWIFICPNFIARKMLPFTVRSKAFFPTMPETSNVKYHNVIV